MHYHGLGRYADAAQSYQEVLAQNPNQPTALHMLGVLAGQMGQWETAVELIQRSLLLVPEEALAHSNLAKLLYDHDDLDAAIAECREAVRLDPDLAEGHYNLANALDAKGDVDAAIESYRRAISSRPEYGKAHHNLANAYKDRAEVDTAVEVARRALELCPEIPEVHSNLIFTMLFQPNADPLAIRAECERFHLAHAQPLANALPPHYVQRDAKRPLRIGYVSPDFREHCQALFTVPLFSHHDRQRFHITAYSDVRRPDAITARLRGYCDEWRDISALDHAAAAQLIRNDQIDILIDLTMHMAHNRLLVFAQKPAPVQACWLAFPGTTGLSAIDFRLTDPHLDPPADHLDAHDHFYTENTVRLPHTFWCYDPLCDLPTTPLPAATSGIVTFGCLNSFAKITHETLELWGTILREIPHSRLLILAPEGLARQRVEDALSRFATRDRIAFNSFLPRTEYLKSYHPIDIALDTFPVNGHTTSLDALWMGVPVVTRYGKGALGRAGLSQLTNLNLPELIAQTPPEYARIAIDLARDLPRLAALRSTLRSRMLASPLMDARRFAQDVESSYVDMWTDGHNLRR